jgi:hypothetical protein
MLALAIVATACAHSPQLYAQTAAREVYGVSKNSETPQWSVQVKMVDPGDVNIAGSPFQIATYENLLDELSKTKRFKQVLREGESTSSPDLLILRTTVQKYKAGSETKRAVTTIGGATKLAVRTQLCTRDGQIVFERTVHGNVLFVGSDLRATHNLARNVAKTIKQSRLPMLSMSALVPSDDRWIACPRRQA